MSTSLPTLPTAQLIAMGVLPTVGGHACVTSAPKIRLHITVWDALTGKWIAIEKAIFLNVAQVSQIRSWAHMQAAEESAFGEFDYKQFDRVWLGGPKKPMLFGHRFIAEVL